MSNVTSLNATDAGPAPLMSKLEMTELVMAAKFTKGLSWKEISEAAGMSDVFVVSACLGQNTLPKEAAAKVAAVLGLGNRTKDVEIALQLPPKKGQEAETVSKDPLIYRFFEITYVYGDTIKELIHEEFGDGIMSAIDFDLKVERVANPKGDRVQVTMSGKFLPYNQW
ncbi:cyanate lyase [Breoghania corrubedonensis]|uniref:Cyanate hydratase n=1 Tax=Breoghania corrubedonensis TaxID=665038 RepID=A0A2T5V7T3_9HYPH|nr:cyanase [Breoghania corrubedonensis]PTW59819.1 cyanate lyase [Breoghania corrubedonensis]